MYKHLTLQEIFTRTKQHLLTQGEQATYLNDDCDGACAYRIVREGKLLKCAGGYWIPDDQYHENMEERGVKGLDFFLENFTTKQLHFIDSLQILHDMNPPEIWEEKLRERAERYNLSYEDVSNGSNATNPSV